MDTLADITLVAATLAFVSGLLLTANSGKARPVKIFLCILTLIVVLGFVGGLIFSRGLLIFFLFHIIALILLTYCVVVVGAVCGAGLYAHLHKKPAGKSLGKPELDEYLSAAEFAALEGMTEERVLTRTKSGYYQSGLNEGIWYVHKSELSQNKTA